MGKDRRIKYPCAVRRVRLDLKDGKWVVRKSVRVKSMTLPRSLEAATATHSTASCFEAVDKKGNVIYRCRAPRTEPRRLELFEPDGSIYPHETRDLPRSIEVMIPDNSSITELVYRMPVKHRRNKQEMQEQVISIEEIDKGEKE